MRTLKTIYANATLTIPEWLKPLWPHELPLDQWPTFCGAGVGMGDKGVPDSIGGVCISAICFIHDVDWATSPDTWRAFQATNNRFLKNLLAILVAHLDGWHLAKAVVRATWYFAAVSTVGWLCFNPTGEDWSENPVVKAKLARLYAVTARLNANE